MSGRFCLAMHSRLILFRADLIALGIFSDFGDFVSDNEIVVFEDDAAALKISDVNLINRDTHDLDSGAYHLPLRSDRLSPIKD